MNTFIEVSTYVRIRLWNSCSCGGHEGGYVVCHRLVESHNVEEQAMAREDEKSMPHKPFLCTVALGSIRSGLSAIPTYTSQYSVQSQ